MPNYSRKCRTCGRWINLREMQHRQWVAFEGDQPHACKKPPIIKVKAAPKPKLTPVEDFPSINIPSDITHGSVAKTALQFKQELCQPEFPPISVSSKTKKPNTPPPLANATSPPSRKPTPVVNESRPVAKKTRKLHRKPTLPERSPSLGSMQAGETSEASVKTTQRNVGVWGWIWGALAIYFIVSLVRILASPLGE